MPVWAGARWALLTQCSSHCPHQGGLKLQSQSPPGSGIDSAGLLRKLEEAGTSLSHFPTKTAEPQPTLFLLYPGLWALLFSPLCKVVRFDKVIFSSWTELLFLRADQLVSCKPPRVEVNQEKGPSDASFYVSQIICILILCL